MDTIPTPPPQLPLLSDFALAAQLTGFSVFTLKHWYARRKTPPDGFPDPLRVGGRVLRYRTADLLAWVNSLGTATAATTTAGTAATSTDAPQRRRPGRPRMAGGRQ